MMKSMKRLPMLEWLKQKLDNAEYPGLNWIDRRRGLFRVAWKHGSRQTYSLDKDASVFRAWAMYTGKYDEDKEAPDPKRWKTNFRCALNILPGIDEVRESRKQGLTAQKVYVMKDVERKKELKRKPTKGCKGTKVKRSMYEWPSDSEIVELVDEMRASSSPVAVNITCDVTSSDNVTLSSGVTTQPDVTLLSTMTTQPGVTLFGNHELMQIAALLQKGLAYNSDETFAPWLVPAVQSEVEIAS